MALVKTNPTTYPRFVRISSNKKPIQRSVDLLYFFNCGNSHKILQHFIVWRVGKWIVVGYVTFKMSHDATMSG